jgi:hypothetical protein
MTQLLKASSTADFLAMVPAITGYYSRNSIVFVMFSGKRTGGGIRFDLPVRRREADNRAIGSAAIGMLSRVRGVDRVIPVIYTDETFEGEHGIPWLDLGRSLRRRLRDGGFDVTEVLCVAADGWGSYVDRECPASGWPLSNIEQSALHGDVVRIQGSSARDLDELGRLPIASDEDQAATNDWLGRNCEPFGGDRIAAAVGNGDDPSERIEQLLAGDAAPSPDELAWLLLHVHAPANRDAATLQIAFGAAHADQVRRDDARLHALKAVLGLSMDEVVQRDIAAGQASRDHRGVLDLMGNSGKRPDPRRLELGIEVVRSMVARAGRVPTGRAVHPRVVVVGARDVVDRRPLRRSGSRTRAGLWNGKDLLRPVLWRTVARLGLRPKLERRSHLMQ